MDQRQQRRAFRDLSTIIDQLVQQSTDPEIQKLLRDSVDLPVLRLLERDRCKRLPFKDELGLNRERFHPERDTNIPLPRSECEKVEDFLERLACLVRFEFDELKGNYGETWWDDPTSELPKSKQHHGKGASSVIYIDKELLSGLDLSNLQPDQVRTRWVELALIVVHELGHSVHLAEAGWEGKPEAFFKRNIYAEMGFAIENEILGGPVSRQLTTEGKEVLACGRTPSASMVQTYQRHAVFSLEGSLQLDSDCFRIVSHNFIKKLLDFESDFWSRTVPNTMGRALFVETSLCYCGECIIMAVNTKTIIEKEPLNLRRYMTSIDKLTPQQIEEIRRLPRRDAERMWAMRQQCVWHRHAREPTHKEAAEITALQQKFAKEVKRAEWQAKHGKVS